MSQKEKGVDRIREELIRQFSALPRLGTPEQKSPYKLSFPVDPGARTVEIIKFSDFECPACKMMSESLDKLAHRYRGKVEISYFFYPLDIACNSNIKRVFHRNACNASYLAYCLPEKFREIEHLIFSKQGSLTDDWIRDKAQEEGVLDCFESPDTKEAVVEMIRGSAPFNISSTPTLLVDGKKISGGLPVNQLAILVDAILEGPLEQEQDSPVEDSAEQ